MYKGDTGSSLDKNKDLKQKEERKNRQPWEMGIGQDTKHIDELLKRRKDKLQDKPYTKLRTFLSNLDKSVQTYQTNVEKLAGIKRSEEGELSFRGKASQNKQEFLERLPPELFKHESTKTSFLEKYEELVAEIDILRAESERGLGDWTGRTKKQPSVQGSRLSM